jgi:GTP-binding protein Era
MVTEAGSTETGSRRAGFVALLGAPNAGKSTLLNRLVGAKISIVTPKAQTTRTRVLGIALHGQTQLIFIDTPGIFEAKKRFDRAMVAAAWAGAASADIVAVLVDASHSIREDTRRLLSGLKDQSIKAVLVLNKIDLVARNKLLVLADELNREGVFTDIFMVSAATGDGVDDLMEHFAARLPLGPWLYPEDQLSDMPQALLAAEVTREQLFLQLRQELPYAATVEPESWKTLEDGGAKIDQVIYVERDSHKPIVLGKGGARIKAIGTAARRELEQMFGHPVHLFLHVKVRGWSEKPEHYRALGLDFDA